MIERVYHSYEKWEDYKWGMYEKTCWMDEEQMTNECQNLLSCPEWLEEAMMFVATDWVFSAEHNLSNVNRNRQAWLGQVACNMTHGAPEYLTKIAWNRLTLEQQEKANKVADSVIKYWEELHKKDIGNGEDRSW
ncbi:MAG: hypothetical protein ACK5YR_02260 [Pirellula sp.]|jgi:vacuolar-type H+-ATPase catalytic subunit A/Vma1